MMINGIQCISEEEPEMCNLLWIRKNQLKVTIETIIKSVDLAFYFCNVSALFSKKLIQIAGNLSNVLFIFVPLPFVLLRTIQTEIIKLEFLIVELIETYENADIKFH